MSKKIQTLVPKTEDQQQDSALMGEIVSEIDEANLSPKEFQCLMAILSSVTNREAFEKSPYAHMRYFEEKKRQLHPLIERIQDQFRARSLNRLAILAPKAIDALEEMLDQLEGSRSDTRRRVAADILDRALGKPTVTAAVKEERDERIEVVFPDWVKSKLEDSAE